MDKKEEDFAKNFDKKIHSLVEDQISLWEDELDDMRIYAAIATVLIANGAMILLAAGANTKTLKRMAARSVETGRKRFELNCAEEESNDTRS